MIQPEISGIAPSFIVKDVRAALAEGRRRRSSAELHAGYQTTYCARGRLPSYVVILMR
jgi:hypothetical protein